MDYDGNKRDSEQLRSPNQPHPTSCQSAYCGQKIRFARPNVPLPQNMYGRETFHCHVCKIKKINIFERGEHWLQYIVTSGIPVTVSLVRISSCVCIAMNGVKCGSSCLLNAKYKAYSKHNSNGINNNYYFMEYHDCGSKFLCHAIK